jgi:PAS domain S-box-containing protein
VIPVRHAPSPPPVHRPFDAVAAAARLSVRGHHAPHEALNTYLATVRVAALVADDAGCYIGANDAACRLTGYEIGELLTLSVSDITAHEDEGHGTRLWNAFVRSDYQRGTFTIVRKDGTSARVVYHAYSNLVAGVHVSFLQPAEADAPAL